MNILFLGYWDADDPLTSATILPHLKIIRENLVVSKIIFTSVQREDYSAKFIEKMNNLNVIFKPVFSRNLPINIINKIYDFIVLPRDIIAIAKFYNITKIIARGAPAGALAYLVNKKTRIPFTVESYEPHANYMLETGIWKNYDLRFIMQNFWERKINDLSEHLVTVSSGYKNQLESEGVLSSKIKVAHCAVDPNKFFINHEGGKAIRKQLEIPDSAMVGIYVGKFGGLYYNHKTFKLIEKLTSFFDEELYFILLNNSPEKGFIQNCSIHHLDISRIRKTFVLHENVNDYLNAANFAIAPYRKTNSAQYLSPVKLGEYWAVGLPSLLTKGVGDETKFIEDKQLGIALDMHKLEDSTYFDEKITEFKKNINNHKSEYIRDFALKNRSFSEIKEVYQSILV